MQELNYSELTAEAIDFLSNNKYMVLATSYQDHVTARTVSIINDGLTVLFQTDREFVKYQQITQNPLVALCAGNMQIEGIAKISGHPLDNQFFKTHFQERHPSAFQRYSHLEVNVIIEVQPTLITFWKYDQEHKPYRDYLDVKGQRAYREYYLD